MGRLLKVLIALGALWLLAVVGFFFTPFGRALMHTAVGMGRAAISPAAQEMKRNGCDMAFVTNVHETFGSLGKALGKKESAALPPDLTAVMCQARFGRTPPTCDRLAVAYGRMDGAPESFWVAVLGGKRERVCSGVFDRSGRRLDAPAASAPGGDAAPAPAPAPQ